MKLNKNYAGISFLYRKNGAVSTIMEIVMKEKVNGPMLQAAVNFTLSRHPYFKSSLQERNGDYYIAENEIPFNVEETRKLHPLGSKELNYHLMDVTYYDKQIFVAFHHALCDGLGARRFVETLVCYYCELHYDVSIENGDGTLPKAGDILDPFAGDYYPVDQNSPMPVSIRDTYVIPEAPDHLTDDTDYRYAFTLNNGSLVTYAKSIGASPATAVALLMNKAIHSVHPEAEKPIVCSMASSIREGLGADNTFKNCVNSIKLPYDPAQSDVEQVAAYKQIIKAHKDPNYCKQCANQMIGLFRKLDGLHTLEEKKRMMAFFDDIRVTTFSMSYTGRLNLNDCEKYIESTHLYSSGNNDILLNMMSIGETTSINLIQPFTDECYIDAFNAQLAQAGITYVASERITFTTPRDAIADTPAIESVRKDNDLWRKYLDSLI